MIFKIVIFNIVTFQDRGRPQGNINKKGQRQGQRQQGQRQGQRQQGQRQAQRHLLYS